MINEYVLVLNQNYDPLCVCTAKRAIVLVFLGKAEIVDTYAEPIRTVSAVVPLPCVIRLTVFVKVPHHDVLLSRKNVLKRDGHQCQYCGTTKGPLTVDHIIPRRRGGEDRWDNLVCACQSCNSLKGDRTLDQSELLLLRKPITPSKIHFIQDFIRVGHQSWRPYLFLKTEQR